MVSAGSARGPLKVLQAYRLYIILAKTGFNTHSSLLINSSGIGKPMGQLDSLVIVIECLCFYCSSKTQRVYPSARQLVVGRAGRYSVSH